MKIANGAINNTSTCVTSGFGNYTANGNANLFRKQEVTINHILGNVNSKSYYTGIWVDYNHNGVFEEDEFTLNGLLSGDTSISWFTVPADALLGTTRMRIRLRPFSVFNGPIKFSDACTNLIGETEDYTVTISDAPACSGSVTAGTITAVPNICPNQNFTITATGATDAQSEMRYGWQKSTDGVNWVNLKNTRFLVNELTLSENESTYYRLTDTCLVSGSTAVSNEILVTANDMFDCYCNVATGNCSVYGIDSVSFNTIHNYSGLWCRIY